MRRNLNRFQTFDDFKMERWMKVPSKIADQVRLDRTPSPLRRALLQEQREHEQDPKYHIKKNMKTIHQINREVQSNIKASQLEEEKKKKAVAEIGHGKLPKGVQNIMLREIEMNKRPQGTKILDEDERKMLLRGLTKEKKNLQNEMERMSVTQHTIRAQNQYKGFAQKLDDIDSSMKVLERKRFIYAA